MIGFSDDIKKNFLACGVGSLPFKEYRDAVDFVFGVFSNHIPFWPQLPQASFYENMYIQYSEKFPGIEIDESSKTVWVDTQQSGYLSALEECFNKTQIPDVDYFAISRSYAQGLYLFSQRLKMMSWQGWVKAQVIGPVSLGLSLLDENKKPIIYNSELSELLPLFLSLKAAWLIKQLRVHAKTRIIIFIDEPYLVAVGTNQCSIPREKVMANINQLVGMIHENGALAGLHCCGNTDWDLVMSTDIDILNFDAYNYLDNVLLYSSSLERFLARGGIPAMGIVPTGDDLVKEGLSEDLFAALRKHPAFLKNGALITSSCGCSGLTIELNKRAQGLCVELAERLRLEF